MKRFRMMAIGAMAVTGLLLVGEAMAGDGARQIIVNGRALDAAEIARADQHARLRLPNGHYWFDRDTGYWGTQGGPALGRVPPEASTNAWMAPADVSASN